MGMVIKLFSNQKHYYKNDSLVMRIRKISMERQLIVGGLFMLIGLCIDIYIFWIWVGNNFKDIFMPQKAIVSLYFLFIGLSIIFFSFFRAILDKQE
jgi:hypothetical protein